MKMTDRVFNNRDEKIVAFINENRDDVERILRNNYDFYRSERLKDSLNWLLIAGMYVGSILVLVVLTCLLYALVK